MPFMKPLLFIDKLLNRKLSKHVFELRMDKFRKSFDYNYYSNYQINFDSELTKLFSKHGSDKGAPINSIGLPYDWNPHLYSTFYARIFHHSRPFITKVFECGIGDFKSATGKTGSGGSLRAWRDYFLNAEIIGADIDKSLLFTENRIRTFHLDQLDPNSIKFFWNNLQITNFDLMIDDGLHEFKAGTTLFENSIMHLSTNGTYIIEDIRRRDLEKYRAYFEKEKYDVEFITMRSNILDYEDGDNSLIVIRKI